MLLPMLFAAAVPSAFCCLTETPGFSEVSTWATLGLLLLETVVSCMLLLFFVIMLVLFLSIIDSKFVLVLDIGRLNKSIL